MGTGSTSDIGLGPTALPPPPSAPPLTLTTAEPTGPSFDAPRARPTDDTDTFDTAVAGSGLPTLAAIDFDRSAGLLIGFTPGAETTPRIGGYLSLRDGRIRLGVSVLRDARADRASVSISAGDTSVRGSVDTAPDAEPTMRLSASTRVGPVSLGTSLGGTTAAPVLGPSLALTLGTTTWSTGFDMSVLAPDHLTQRLTLSTAIIARLSLDFSGTASTDGATFRLGFMARPDSSSIGFAVGYDSFNATPTIEASALIDNAVSISANASLGSDPSASLSITLRDVVPPAFIDDDVR